MRRKNTAEKANFLKYEALFCGGYDIMLISIATFSMTRMIDDVKEIARIVLLSLLRGTTNNRFISEKSTT